MSIQFHKEDPDEIFRSEEHNEEIWRREEAEKEAKKKRRGEMPEDKKPKKYINYMQLDEDVWSILVSSANKNGDSLAQFCADVLAAASVDIEKTISSSAFKLSALRRRARNHLENMLAIEAIAAEYNSDPSPELADILVQMCDELGKNPDDIKSKVANDPMSESIASFKANPGTKTAKCRKWMIDFMRRNNYYAPASVGNEEGDALGFKRDMIAQVRRGLLIDSVQDNDTGAHYWSVTKKSKAAQAILNGGKDEWEIRN